MIPGNKAWSFVPSFFLPFICSFPPSLPAHTGTVAYGVLCGSESKVIQNPTEMHLFFFFHFSLSHSLLHPMAHLLFPFTFFWAWDKRLVAIGNKTAHPIFVCYFRKEHTKRKQEKMLFFFFLSLCSMLIISPTLPAEDSSVHSLILFFIVWKQKQSYNK